MYSRGIGSSRPNQRKVICVRSRGPHDEVIDGARPMLRTGPQDGRRKCRLIRRVREVLRLEREARAVAERNTALSGHGAVEEVAGVALHARLGSVDVEPSAAKWIG